MHEADDATGWGRDPEDDDQPAEAGWPAVDDPDERQRRQSMSPTETSGEGGDESDEEETGTADFAEAAVPSVLPHAGHHDEVDSAEADRPDFADGNHRHLDPNFIPAERVGWWITQAVVDGGITFFLVLQWLLDWFEGWHEVMVVIAGLGVIAGLLYLSLRMPRLVYDNTSYAVSPLGMEIRRGIFWKHVIDVPRSRIQHTDVTQGPVQRRFGISTITLHTAGTANASVGLTGLNYHHALEVRDYLIRSGDTDAV